MQNPYRQALDIQNACNASGVMMSAPDLARAVNHELRTFGLADIMNFRRHPVIVLYANKLADLTGQFSDGHPYGPACDLATRIAAGEISLGSNEHETALLAYYATLNDR